MKKKPGKMQHVDFATIAEILDYLPEHELVIVERLRDLILTEVPDCRETVTYNVPFYSRHYRLAYIWPGAVDWGGKVSEGVTLGFAQGNLMADGGYLEKGRRKQVRTRHFLRAEEIDAEILRALLLDAVRVDSELKEMKGK